MEKTNPTLKRTLSLRLALARRRLYLITHKDTQVRPGEHAEHGPQSLPVTVTERPARRPLRLRV